MTRYEPEDFHWPFALSKSSHVHPQDGFSLLDAANWLTHCRQGVTSQKICPVLHQYCEEIPAWLSNQGMVSLQDYVHRLPDTLDPEVEAERRTYLVACRARLILPIVMDMYGYPRQAEMLRALPADGSLHELQQAHDAAMEELGERNRYTIAGDPATDDMFLGILDGLLAIGKRVSAPDYKDFTFAVAKFTVNQSAHWDSRVRVLAMNMDAAVSAYVRASQDTDSPCEGPCPVVMGWLRFMSGSVHLSQRHELLEFVPEVARSSDPALLPGRTMALLRFCAIDVIRGMLSYSRPDMYRLLSLDGDCTPEDIVKAMFLLNDESSHPTFFLQAVTHHVHDAASWLTAPSLVSVSTKVQSRNILRIEKAPAKASARAFAWGCLARLGIGHAKRAAQQAMTEKLMRESVKDIHDGMLAARAQLKSSACLLEMLVYLPRQAWTLDSWKAGLEMMPRLLRMDGVTATSQAG